MEAAARHEILLPFTGRPQVRGQLGVGRDRRIDGGQVGWGVGCWTLGAHRPGDCQHHLTHREGSARGLVDVLQRRLLRLSLWRPHVLNDGQAVQDGLLNVRQELQLPQHDAELDWRSDHGLAASVVSNRKARVVLAFRRGHSIERCHDHSSC